MKIITLHVSFKAIVGPEHWIRAQRTIEVPNRATVNDMTEMAKDFYYERFEPYYHFTLDQEKVDKHD